VTTRPTSHGEPLAEVRSGVISVLREVGGPDMTGETAECMLRRAHAWESVGARQLATYLSEHNDAFVAPSPHIPLAMATMFKLLADNGFGDRVVLPGCVRCGRTDKVLKRPTPEGRCCERCMERVGGECALGAARSAGSSASARKAGYAGHATGETRPGTPSARSAAGPLRSSAAPKRVRRCAIAVNRDRRSRACTAAASGSSARTPPKARCVRTVTAHHLVNAAYAERSARSRAAVMAVIARTCARVVVATPVNASDAVGIGADRAIAAARSTAAAVTQRRRDRAPSARACNR
jgi:hypothetical protein